MPDCDGAGVVEDRKAAPLVGILLICGLVFFIDDDETQAGKRGEKGAARADDHVDVAVRGPFARRRTAGWRSTRSELPRRGQGTGRRNGQTVCGVSAISGTRTMAWRLRARVSAIARR